MPREWRKPESALGGEELGYSQQMLQSRLPMDAFAATGIRFTLAKWDPKGPASAENLILVTAAEAEAHKGPAEVPDAVRERVEASLAWAQSQLRRPGRLGAAAAKEPAAPVEATSFCPPQRRTQKERVPPSLDEEPRPVWLEEGHKKLCSSFLAIVGLGSVGSAAAALLARAGVARLRLVDGSHISCSARHALARDADQGRPKVDVCEDLMYEVLPHASIEVWRQHLAAGIEPQLLGASEDGRCPDTLWHFGKLSVSAMDMLLDCMGGTSGKELLLRYALEHHLPVVSVASDAAGPGLVPADPSRLVVANFSEVWASPPTAELRQRLGWQFAKGDDDVFKNIDVGSAANAMADPSEGTMKRSTEQPTEVSVHCLAGSSFELEVNSAEPGREVAERIAAGVGHPACLLVLTSGGCVIDQRQLLLPQVQHDEIWYVVRRLGEGRVAMLWERLLEEKTLSDVAALNETMSLTWYSGQDLNRGIQLPSSLQSLTFGQYFDQSLEGIQLPSSLQSLTFGQYFDQSLEGIQLPSSLQSLTFGDYFNQSLEGIQLPSSLQSLTFGSGFNQSLEGIQLPSSLQSLTFGYEFNQSLEGIQLPSSLQSLTFRSEYQSLEGIQLPSSLQSLTFDQSLEGIQLPSSLQSLTFGYEFNQSLEGIQLPSSLQSLTFGYEFNQSLEGIQLPSSLQSLTFGDCFNQSLEGIQLPSSLQSLTFGQYFDQSLEGIQLPSSLQRHPTAQQPAEFDFWAAVRSFFWAWFGFLKNVLQQLFFVVTETGIDVAALWAKVAGGGVGIEHRLQLGITAAATTILRLTGGKVPQQADPCGMNFWKKLRHNLERQEPGVELPDWGGPLGGLGDLYGIGCVADFVWRGRSALSHQVGAKHSDMGLTRWDHRRPPSLDNLVLLTAQEAQSHHAGCKATGSLPKEVLAALDRGSSQEVVGPL
eukprot:s3802_g2.t1